MMPKTIEIGLDRWHALDDENGAGWRLILKGLKGKTARPERRHPWPHLKKAIAAAKNYFGCLKNTRGRAILPCGTGKSLLAYWIAEALKAKTIVVAVPSLQLIKQSVADWTREFLAKGQMPEWVCVCSDESVGNLENDEYVGEVYELGLPTCTDPKKIAALLRGDGPKIVFTTYHSSDRLAEAARLAGVTFDLVIFDEAHRTAGHRDKAFATLLHERFKARRRLFMTATERVVNGGGEEVFSMDNEEAYGECFYTMTFKEAISLGIITDYKILTVLVSEDRIGRLITENRLLNLGCNLTEAEARNVATGIALKDAIKKHAIKKAISFHSSILAADRFREQQDVLNFLRPKCINAHISSKMTAGERDDLMRAFKNTTSAPVLMTNARCLTEGINVPTIDCVVFADPKQSATDIIQAAAAPCGKRRARSTATSCCRSLCHVEWSSTSLLRQPPSAKSCESSLRCQSLTRASSASFGQPIMAASRTEMRATYRLECECHSAALPTQSQRGFGKPLRA
jgi:predicted helicase